MSTELAMLPTQGQDSVLSLSQEAIDDLFSLIQGFANLSGDEKSSLAEAILELTAAALVSDYLKLLESL